MGQIIFLHIPKTAGNSLRKFLKLNLPNSVYTIFFGRHHNEENSGTIKEFLSLNENEKESYRCIAGHLSFGFHKHLLWPTQYITILRDPIEPIISQYCMLKQAGRIKTTLEELCKSNRYFINNLQTRKLSGTPKQYSIKRAKTNLLKCSVVGTHDLELYDMARSLLNKACHRVGI
jgi:hypothetical protein